ncbi:MAG: HAD family phosphatase [Anaerolineae bacterium]|nr:HAD family phosphatase [Anaerolineae bacterium]
MDADQRISDRVRQALAETLARGVIVTLATGRMFSATRSFAEDLGITAPLLCCQGGWIQARGGEVLHRIALPTSVAEVALALGESHGWETVVYADGQLFARETLHSDAFYAGLLGVPNSKKTWAEVMANHVVDKVLYVAEPDQIPAIGKVLNQHFAEAAEVIQSHSRFIEVIPQGVSKGNALAWLAAHYGIAQQDVLAVGDQENDLSMVQWAGVGVAMGNAIPKLKQTATWVAPSVTEDGTAALLERFVLEGEFA